MRIIIRLILIQLKVGVPLPDMMAEVRKDKEYKIQINNGRKKCMPLIAPDDFKGNSFELSCRIIDIYKIQTMNMYDLKDICFNYTKACLLSILNEDSFQDILTPTISDLPENQQESDVPDQNFENMSTAITSSTNIVDVNLEKIAGAFTTMMK